MKLQFLGTAAAEGFPSLYCMCEACKEAMSKGGRNIRSRCQALLDDTILLDFGPDTYYHMIMYKVPLESIHHILITHNHEDHLQTDDLYYRREGYAAVIEEEPLYVYGTKPSYDRVMGIASKERFQNVLKAVEVTPFEPFKIHEYNIMPLKASHAPISGPIIFDFKRR
jgi:phosphoribosyl 1,2-cyclic phosphate phosphodiesterase